MPQIKYVRDHKGKKKGDTDEVSSNTAFGLINKGIAIAHKMMTSFQTKRRK